MQSSIPVDDFQNSLKDSGLKLTANRKAVFIELSSSSIPLSIKEIASAVSDKHHFVSVYRAIDALQKARIVKQVPQGFKNKYELSDKFKPHHHHAQCEICHKSIEIKNQELEIMMKSITTSLGFVPTKHYFELFGVCKKCQKQTRV